MLPKSKHRSLVLKYQAVIQQVFDNQPDISAAEAGRQLENQLPYSAKYIRCAISDVVRYLGHTDFSQLEPEESLSIEAEEEIKYTVIDVGDTPTYFWETGYGDIKVPVSQIDQLFYEYSKHGLNLSQTEVINIHGFKTWEWNSIKRVLWLFKNSNIFSPYTWDNTPPHKREDMVAEKMSRFFDNPQQVVEKQYRKQLDKSYKKIIDKYWKEEFKWTQLLTELSEHLPQASEVKTISTSEAPDLQDKTLVVTLADLHIGAQVEESQHLKPFNLDVIKQNIDTIVEEVNGAKAQRVVLAFIGDMIESFSGMNHPNSWQSMEWGMYGSKVVKESIEIVEILLQRIHNVKEIVAVAGNHDRGESSKSVDSRGEIASIIFYFIERMYGNAIDVHFDYDVVTRMYDDICYIVTHGDNAVAKKGKGGKDLVLKYGDNSKFNIILTGHWHSRDIPYDSDLFRWIVCPSIFSGNDYSSKLGFWTMPGYLQIHRKPDGRMSVLDNSL